jgi:hypothetical protein
VDAASDQVASHGFKVLGHAGPHLDQAELGLGVFVKGVRHRRLWGTTQVFSLE